LGTLFIVATPIGNLQDLSLRAIDVLTKVEIIACEDTRHTGLLLKHIKDTPYAGSILRQGVSLQDTKPTLLSYYEHNELRRIPQILNVLHNGVDVALVSDAGTPLLSDPGFPLVREAIRAGIRVEAVPGPSAVTAALAVSGLPTEQFTFWGFLPAKSGRPAQRSSRWV
jgi:16S rRNA (cytidine1402-2'-O)-methyltransferase